MLNEQITVGLNGFGRFALNLLWWWFNDHKVPYTIKYINDDVLTPKDMLHAIKSDQFVIGFRKCKVSLNGMSLMIQDPNGRTETIVLSTGQAEQASWIGVPQMFFECSGRRSASSSLCRAFLVGNTKNVIVSATCYDADETLIIGHNHEIFDPKKHKVVSYGSCTVNPGVILASFFNEVFGVCGCMVHVIHNVQKHRLDSGEFNTLQRKFCTLERIAPRMLPFLNENNFVVRYTVVPWSGVSIIDFAFRLKRVEKNTDAIVDVLKYAISKGGNLEGLIGMTATDTGPEVHIGSPYSVVIVENSIKVIDDTVHLFCYFNNEGSGIRMHELASYISRKLV